MVSSIEMSSHGTNVHKDRMARNKVVVFAIKCHISLIPRSSEISVRWPSKCYVGKEEIWRRRQNKSDKKEDRRENTPRATSAI